MKKSLTLLIALLLTGCASQDIVIIDKPVEQVHDLRDLDFDGVIEAREACDNTLLGALVDNDGCSNMNLAKQAMLLDIKFANNSADIQSQSYKTLQKFSGFLLQQKNKVVTIEGHTDKVGSEEYNKNLSFRRANSVKKVLIEKYKIPANRIAAVGFGEEQPIINDINEEANKVNRRVMASLTNQFNQTQMRWNIFTPEMKAKKK